MKRLVILTAALAIFAGGFNAGAQGRNEINLYIGGLNGFYASLENGNSAHTDLYSMYEPSYNVKCHPTFTLEYNHRLMSWLGVGVQASCARLTGESYYRMGSAPSVKYNQHIASVLHQAKFYIPSPRHFRLYGKVGAGVNLSLGNDIIGNPVSFAWDVVPIGAEWGGQRVYGTAELCVGNVITGGRIGIGFRF